MQKWATVAVKEGMMDQVVCIRDDWGISDIAPDGAKYLPVKGTIYTIREREDIFMLWHGRMKTYFRFEELRNTPKPLADGKLFETCFVAEWFRPVKKTDITLFTDMTLKTKGPENAVSGLPKEDRRIPDRHIKAL